MLLCFPEVEAIISHVSLTQGPSGRAASWLDVCHKRALPSTCLSQSLVLQFRFASNSSFIVLLRSLQRAGLSCVCPTPRPKIGSYERIQNPASKLRVTPPLERPRGAKAWAPARLHPSPPLHLTARACTSQAATRGWERRCARRPSGSQWTIPTEDFKCGGASCILPGRAGGQTSSRCCERLWAAEVRGGTGGEHRGHPTGLGLQLAGVCTPRLAGLLL